MSVDMQVVLVSNTLLTYFWCMLSNENSFVNELMEIISLLDTVHTHKTPFLHSHRVSHSSRWDDLAMEVSEYTSTLSKEAVLENTL